MSEEMKNLFYELKQYLVQHSPKWDTLCDIEQYILDLQQENKELKKQLEIKNDGFMASINETCEYATILEEFEKWLEEEKKKENWEYGDMYFYEFANIVLDKLQELKSDENE